MDSREEVSNEQQPRRVKTGVKDDATVAAPAQFASGHGSVTSATQASSSSSAEPPTAATLVDHDAAANQEDAPLPIVPIDQPDEDLPILVSGGTHGFERIEFVPLRRETNDAPTFYKCTIGGGTSTVAAELLPDLADLDRLRVAPSGRDLLSKKHIPEDYVTDKVATCDCPVEGCNAHFTGLTFEDKTAAPIVKHFVAQHAGLVCVDNSLKGPYCCPIPQCKTKKTLSNDRAFQRHIATVHNENAKTCCRFCGDLAGRWDMRNRHWNGCEDRDEVFKGLLPGPKLHDKILKPKVSYK